MPAKNRRSSAAKPKIKRALSRYKAKRDFSKTPEPSGDSTLPRSLKSAQKSLFYCVQKHLASHLHYDFRLEFNGILLSWAVPKGPSLNPRDKRLAMRVEDHPYDYRDFEGVIPSGYGAGVVMLWDEGAWKPEPGFENIGEALRRGELKFTLEGVKLKGSWVLVRTGRGPDRGATATGEREQWLLIKHRDDWAGEVDVTKVAGRGVRSDLDFQGILKSDPAVWESHKAGSSDELEKIVQKVVALEEKEGASPASRKRISGASAAKKSAAPRKRSRRT
jgi:bifunctional non-homologous end joining protein LigD